jgi:hypothetical protein
MISVFPPTVRATPPGEEEIVEVRVHKAKRAVQDEPVPTLVIRVCEETPSSEGMYGATGKAWLIYQRALEETYGVDARTIARALHEALPGGTLDRLVAELLIVKASMFRVSLFDPKRPQDDVEFEVVARALAAHRAAREAAQGAMEEPGASGTDREAGGGEDRDGKPGRAGGS